MQNERGEILTILVAVGVALFFLGAAILTLTARCDEPDTQHCLGELESPSQETPK